MTIPAQMLRRVVDPQPGTAPAPLSPRDAQNVLEIATMAIAADGMLTDDEIDAFRVIGARVLERAGAPEEPLLSEKDTDTILGRVAMVRAREDAVAQLRKAATALTSDTARELAFKAAVALAAADLAASDEEFEFEIDLVDALGLSNETAERLSAEVQEALTPDPE